MESVIVVGRDCKKDTHGVTKSEPVLMHPIDSLPRSHVGGKGKEITVDPIVDNPTTTARFDGRVEAAGEELLLTRVLSHERHAAGEVGRHGVLVVCREFKFPPRLRSLGVRGREGTS